MAIGKSNYQIRGQTLNLFDDTRRNLDFHIAEYRYHQKIFNSDLPLWIVENLLRDK